MEVSIKRAGYVKEACESIEVRKSRRTHVRVCGGFRNVAKDEGRSLRTFLEVLEYIVVFFTQLIVRHRGRYS